MKTKVVFVSLCLALVLAIGSLGFAGCASPAPAPAPSPSPAPTAKPSPAPAPSTAPAVSKEGWPKSFVFGTSPVGGGVYTMGIPWAVKLTEVLGIKVEALTTVGASGNTMMLSRKELQAGNISAEHGYRGTRALKEYEKTGKIPLRVMFNIYPIARVFFASGASGIKKVTDMKGKKIMGDMPSAPVQKEWTEAALTANGMTLKDIILMPYSSPREATDALRAKTADAFSFSMTTPPDKYPYLVEIAETLNGCIVDLGKAPAEKISSTSPWFYAFRIPAGSYKGQTEDIWTIAQTNHFAVLAEMPESLVYSVVKATFDNLDTLKAASNLWDYVNVQHAVEGAMLLPFHDGAVKFFKEKGVWTKELDDTQKKLLEELK